MPIIKFMANKMSEAKVSHISLVERGANRIPFRIIKQEKEGMKHFEGLDLGGLLSRTRKGDKTKVADITAVVTMKGEGFESIKKKLEEAGVSTANAVENEDGSVVFKQGDGDIDGTVVRVNEHVAFVAKGFSPYNIDMDSGDASFSDMVQAQGFYPGINTIMGVLSNAITDSVRNSANPSEAKAAVQKMFAEAQAYTLSFVSALPVVAFKLEGVEPEAVEKAAKMMKCKSCGAEMPQGTDKCPDCGADPTATPAKKEDETTGSGSTADEEVTCKACGTKKKKPDMAKKEDGTDLEVCTECHAKKSDQTAPESLTLEQVSSIVSTQVAEVSGPMADAVKKMGELLSGLSSQLEEMAPTIKGLTDRMTEVETVAKSATEAVRGTVVGGVGAGDSIASFASARKSESGFAGREIDTAFMPRRKRQ